MDCKDCHRYSFAQQHGPHARLQDGTKPMIRQCAARQRYDRWRKRHGNALEYSAWHSTVDLHGPRYAADKDIRDQAMEFVTLSNVEKAKGWFDETLLANFSMHSLGSRIQFQQKLLSPCTRQREDSSSKIGRHFVYVKYC